MQWKSAVPGKLSGWRNFTVPTAFLLAALVGCGGDATVPVPAKAPQPFAGQKFRIRCENAVVGSEFARRANAWAKRAGAEIVASAAAPTEWDVAIIRPAELGAFVAANEALPIPEALRDASHPLQWSRLLPLSIDRLAGWGTEARAVPLAGEAYVLAYRAERFTDTKAGEDFSRKHGRPLTVPTTWEDFATVAEFFANRGLPSLPSVANDADRLLREFHHVAACYDRPPVTGAAFGELMRDAKSRDASVNQFLAFHHDLQTGEPRLLKPAFLEAAKWLHRTAPCRAPVGTPPVMAVVSLSELAQLQPISSIGVAPLPGTKVSYDAKTGRAMPPADKNKGLNFVPYHGAGGWIGVVRTGRPNPEAAFDLLADLSRLERSAELLSDPALGFGPFRVEHLDQSHETLWQRYGFDAQQTHRLAEAIRYDLDVGLANPAIALRGADQAELMKLLGEQLNRIVTGAVSPEEAMKAADAAWRKADSARPAEALKQERRRSAGLQ